MIQNRRHGLLIVLLILSFCTFSSTSFGQPRAVSIEYQINASTINRFIASQTFPTLTGTYSSYSYNISITPPVVQLNTNSATVQFTIIANTSIGNYSFTVQPTFTIPNLDVSLSQITAIIQQFDTIINNRSDIPSWLKPIIIAGYNNLDLTIYPSKLLDYANSMIPNWADIHVTDIGVSFAVIPNAIDFTFTPTILGTPPSFSCQWLKPRPQLMYLRFNSTVATTIYQVGVYNSLGKQVYQNLNLNSDISKDGTSSQIGIGYLATGNYYIYVLFHSDKGEYARYYYLSYDTDNYNTWFTATLGSSLN